jgi:hypothetical protein
MRTRRYSEVSVPDPGLPGIRLAWAAMSKKTVKRKLRSKKKANHGKRPNAGRG